MRTALTLQHWLVLLLWWSLRQTHLLLLVSMRAGVTLAVLLLLWELVVMLLFYTHWLSMIGCHWHWHLAVHELL